jgi:hypothetical protein
MENAFKDSSKYLIGIPDDNDSEEITFQYGDLNGDGKSDGLITFHPQQCDGGNAMAWSQEQVLVVSEKDRYKVFDNFFDSSFQNSLEKLSDQGIENYIFYIDSFTSKKLFGTVFMFSDTDGHCCPSLRRSFTVAYPSKDITMGDLIGKRGEFLFRMNK